MDLFNNDSALRRYFIKYLFISGLIIILVFVLLLVYMLLSAWYSEMKLRVLDIDDSYYIEKRIRNDKYYRYLVHHEHKESLIFEFEKTGYLVTMLVDLQKDTINFYHFDHLEIEMINRKIGKYYFNVKEVSSDEYMSLRSLLKDDNN